MRSIVLGASGFVGAAIVDELIARGDEVVAIDRHITAGKAQDTSNRAVKYFAGDITRRETLYPLFEGADEIYHLAAVLGTSELDTAIRDSVEVNVVGTINVIEVAIKSHVKRMFLASKPHVWLNTYTITKHCAEQMARLYTRYHPIRISALRYLNIYGPRQKLYSVRKVLPVFAAQALRGHPLQVYGDGEQTVDMIYSRDAARLTVDFLRADYDGGTPDCGTGDAITVNDVARAVNEHYGNRAGILHVPMRRGETPGTQLVADTRALRHALGELTFTPWQTALAETLDWYAKLDPHELDAALTYHGLAQPHDMAWIPEPFTGAHDSDIYRMASSEP
ncbi:MAG: NAD-dependent epimerase/dehydratase family protein [Polyangiales bacterium]